MDSIFNNLPDENRGEKRLVENAIVNQFVEDARNNELLNKRHLAPLNSRRYNFFKTISVLFLLTILALGGYYLYLLKEGKFNSTVNQICGSITCQECPSIPADNISCENICELTCNQNFTCPDCICGGTA